MAATNFSDKEQSLLDAARRELAAKRAASVADRRAPQLVTTPMDQPTVLGWDHPEAKQAQPRVTIAADKLQQIAVLMEQERTVELERRAAFRKRALYVMLGVAVALLALVIAVVRR
jgi:hypothetical protein